MWYRKNSHTQTHVCISRGVFPFHVNPSSQARNLRKERERERYARPISRVLPLITDLIAFRKPLSIFLSFSYFFSPSRAFCREKLCARISRPITVGSQSEGDDFRKTITDEDIYSKAYKGKVGGGENRGKSRTVERVVKSSVGGV